MRKVYLVPQEFEEKINDIGVKITNIDSTAGYMTVEHPNFINYSYDGITWRNDYEWMTIDDSRVKGIPDQIQPGQSVYLKAANIYVDHGYFNVGWGTQFKFNVEGDIAYLYEPNGV